MRSRMILLFLLIACLTAMAGAQPRYLGVYAYDCPQDCLDDLRGYANVVVLRVSIMGNPQHDVDQIKQARAAGMKVIFAMFPGFLENPPTENTPEQRERFENWVKAVKPYANDIVAFNPYDEPYLRAFTATGHNFGRNDRIIPAGPGNDEALANSMQTEKAKLEQAGRRIHSELPGIPLIDNEVYEMVKHAGFEVPSNYSWFAIDCYHDFDDCEGKPIPAYYDMLAKHLSAAQKLAAVVPGFVKTGPGGSVNGSGINDLRRQLEKYTSFVKGDSRFEAVLIWSYLDKKEPNFEYHGLSVVGSNVKPDLQNMSHQLGIK